MFYFLLSAKVIIYAVYERNFAKVILTTRTNKPHMKQCILLSQTSSYNPWNSRALGLSEPDLGYQNHIEVIPSGKKIIHSKNLQSRVWGVSVGWVVIWHEASWFYIMFLLTFIRRTITACLNFVNWMIFSFCSFFSPHVTYSRNIYLDHVTYRLHIWVEEIQSNIAVRKKSIPKKLTTMKTYI